MTHISNQYRPNTNLGESHSRFEHQIQCEIKNLHERRAQLGTRLNSKNPPDAAQKQEIMQEYAWLEQTRKFLSMLIEALEKSRQIIAANFR
jgi:hypothetical protein